MRFFLGCALLLVSLYATATSETYTFTSAEQRAVFQTLTANLRCPKCQNQSISDSDAIIANDMRRKVYQLLQQGRSEEQIISYMKARYGDFVYYEPPLTVATLWLWALPPLFIVIGAVVVMRRRKPAPQQDMAARLAQAEQLLKDERS